MKIVENETKVFNFGVNVEPACAEQIEVNLKNPSSTWKQMILDQEDKNKPIS